MDHSFKYIQLIGNIQRYSRKESRDTHAREIVKEQLLQQISIHENIFNKTRGFFSIRTHWKLLYEITDKSFKSLLICFELSSSVPSTRTCFFDNALTFSFNPTVEMFCICGGKHHSEQVQ